MVVASEISGDMPKRKRSARSSVSTGEVDLNGKKPTQKQWQAAKKAAIRLQARRQFFKSGNLSASVSPSGGVAVDVSVKTTESDLEALAKAFKAAQGDLSYEVSNGLQRIDVKNALREAVTHLLERAFGGEIDAITASYRTLLAGSLASEPNPAVAAAMNQARLQARILENTAMLDQAEACEVLGLSKSNPSATMTRKEERGEVLRFTVEGRAVYPLFQFDVSRRRVHPALSAILKAKPDDWSDFRVMHWLTRPHNDFGHAPADGLASASAEVEAAFRREIQPVTHG